LNRACLLEQVLIREQSRSGPVGENPPRSQQHGSCCGGSQEAQVVAGNGFGDTKCSQRLCELPCRAAIQLGRWLIQQEKFRLPDECQCHCYAFALAEVQVRGPPLANRVSTT
jgi:hypothetical protein